MMTLNELLTTLAQQDVQLWVEDERVKIWARKGVLTPVLRSALTTYNAAILALLTGKEQEEPLPVSQSRHTQTAVAAPETCPIDFSLLYFSSNEAGSNEAKYKLLLDSATFADTHGFCAVWIPERHSHPFGG